MDKRKCQKCQVDMATVQCRKSPGILLWWFCEKCYLIVVGEDPTDTVTYSQQGYPGTARPADSWPGIVVFEELLAKWPRGPRGDPRNFDRAAAFIKWYEEGGTWD